MATVCKWLGFYLCMKEPELPVINPIDFQQSQKCDVVVTWKVESPKEKSGGLAFEVILQPAVTSNPPPIIRDMSPTKDVSLNAEEIEKKLKEAEERRLSLEISKLQLVIKSKDRAAEVSQRAQELNESFSRAAEKKLSEKMEANADKKNLQIKALQARLREHASRVEDVCKLAKSYQEQSKERIERELEHKLETAESRREARLKTIQEHLQKHEKHVAEVMELSGRFSRDTEEKLIQKMETSVKNRERQLAVLLDRLHDHERHVERVRKNKLNMSMTEEGSGDTRRLSGASDNTASDNTDDIADLDEGFENEDLVLDESSQKLNVDQTCEVDKNTGQVLEVDRENDALQKLQKDDNENSLSAKNQQNGDEPCGCRKEDEDADKKVDKEHKGINESKGSENVSTTEHNNSSNSNSIVDQPAGLAGGDAV